VTIVLHAATRFDMQQHPRACGERPIDSSLKPLRPMTVSVQKPMGSTAEDRDSPLAPYDCTRRGPGRVLVVDDDEGVRSVMTRQLTHAGFDVVAAQGAQEGLRILREDDSIRIVLLDMIMPAMDGWGFREAQLADPALASIPAIVLTGAPLPTLVHTQLQAADYLMKPVGRDHLVSVVSNYCEPIRAVAPKPATASSSSEPALRFAQP
jgi:CheY-like chemotaxis protein